MVALRFGDVLRIEIVKSLRGGRRERQRRGSQQQEWSYA